MHVSTNYQGILNQRKNVKTLEKLPGELWHLLYSVALRTNRTNIYQEHYFQKHGHAQKACVWYQTEQSSL